LEGSLVKRVEVDEQTHAKLTILKGKLQERTKRSVTYGEVVQRLVEIADVAMEIDEEVLYEPSRLLLGVRTGGGY
jgi:hypothetical protein